MPSSPRSPESAVCAERSPERRQQQRAVLVDRHHPALERDEHAAVGRECTIAVAHGSPLATTSWMKPEGVNVSSAAEGSPATPSTAPGDTRRPRSPRTGPTPCASVPTEGSRPRRERAPANPYPRSLNTCRAPRRASFAASGEWPQGSGKSRPTRERVCPWRSASCRRRRMVDRRRQAQRPGMRRASSAPCRSAWLHCAATDRFRTGDPGWARRRPPIAYARRAATWVPVQTPWIDTSLSKSMPG